MCRNLKLPMPLQCWLLPWRTPIFPHLSSCKRMRAFHTGVRLAALPHLKHAGAAGPIRRLHAARYVGTDAGRLYRRGAVVAAVRRRPRDVPRPHDAADRLQGAGWWCHTSSCLTQKKKKKIIKPLKSMYKRTLNTEHFAADFLFFFSDRVQTVWGPASSGWMRWSPWVLRWCCPRTGPKRRFRLGAKRWARESFQVSQVNFDAWAGRWNHFLSDNQVQLLFILVFVLVFLLIDVVFAS